MTPDGAHSDWGIKMEVLNVSFQNMISFFINTTFFFFIFNLLICCIFTSLC